MEPLTLIIIGSIMVFSGIVLAVAVVVSGRTKPLKEEQADSASYEIQIKDGKEEFVRVTPGSAKEYEETVLLDRNEETILLDNSEEETELLGHGKGKYRSVR